jgi:ABC-type nitrate/sulfonate/bicarbonate transport system ATPase subunit
MATEKGTLEIHSLNKEYPRREGGSLKVLQGISLSLRPGEFVSLLGPSGCGKSTLLRLVMGLEEDYEGQILLDGRRVAGTSLDRGIVFQEHRLFPWLTVEQNVALSLVNADLPKAEKRKTVAEHIALVGLQGFEKAYPHQLSGGMSQRVAIARALANRPEVLLLDEPFGALDALTRSRLQQELQRIWEAEAITAVLVTHDVEEAIYLGDRVVVMEPRPGRVKRVFDVDLPRPRVRGAYAFSTLREEILSELTEGEPAQAHAPARQLPRSADWRFAW